MTRTLVAALALVAFGFVSLASAASMDDMIGKWKWKDFVIEVTKGGEYGISAKVVSGPKNVGMEMIQSKLEKKGDHFVGQIKHPMTGDIYYARMQLTDPDTWKLDGSTKSGVTASGEFKRVK